MRVLVQDFKKSRFLSPTIDFFSTADLGGAEFIFTRKIWIVFLGGGGQIFCENWSFSPDSAADSWTPWAEFSFYELIETVLNGKILLTIWKFSRTSADPIEDPDSD